MDNNQAPKKNQKLTRNTALLKKTPQNSGKRWLKIFGIVAIVIVALAGGYGLKAYFSIQHTVNTAYHSTGKVSKKISQKKPISVLILGVDTGIEGRKDRGNSDTMILATVNPKTKKASLTSVPRDLLAEIKGADEFYMAKVNAAFNVDGVRGSSKTVESMLNVPVDYYVEVDMKALENLVDAVGGIDVKVKFDFTYNTTFKKGKQHLNGKEALDYARMRKEDPQGDYGRQQRQREVIMAIAKKGMSLNGVSNYEKILKVVAKYVKTDMSFDDMMDLVMNYRGAAGDIKSDYIQGHDAWIGGAAFQVAKTSELQRISNQLRKSLDLKKEKLNNELTRQNKLNNMVDWKDLNAFTNYVIYDKNSDTMPWAG